jgi:hypothetical protein
MARRPIDPTGPATGTLTLRLSEQDRDLLDRLVADRAADLAREGIEVTAASYVRGLIRREAEGKGFMSEQPPVTQAPPRGTGRAPRAKTKRAGAKAAKRTKAG